MKASYTGQLSVPSTDRKFRPQDEHLIEKNKEEVDSSEHGASIEPDSKQNRDKFSEVDKNYEKRK